MKYLLIISVIFSSFLSLAQEDNTSIETAAIVMGGISYGTYRLAKPFLRNNNKELKNASPRLYVQSDVNGLVSLGAKKYTNHVGCDFQKVYVEFNAGLKTESKRKLNQGVSIDTLGNSKESRFYFTENYVSYSLISGFYTVSYSQKWIHSFGLGITYSELNQKIKTSEVRKINRLFESDVDLIQLSNKEINLFLTREVEYIFHSFYVGTAVNLGVKVKLNQKKQKTGINYFDDQFSGYANLNLKVGVNF